MTGDWRDFRPAIWLAMIGVAIMLLFNPFYVGAIFIGGAIGVVIRISQRRRRAAAAPVKPARRSGSRRRQ